MTTSEKTRVFKCFSREFEAKFGHLANDVSTTKIKLGEMLANLEACLLRPDDESLDMENGDHDMPTKPRQFRLEDDTMKKIDELAAIQGGTYTPASRAAVIRRAVDAMHKAETRPAKVKEKKS